MMKINSAVLARKLRKKLTSDLTAVTRLSIKSATRSTSRITWDGQDRISANVPTAEQSVPKLKILSQL